MNLVRQMRPVRSMGGQVWRVLWPGRGSIDALRVVLLRPLAQPSGRLLTLDGDGADSIEASSLVWASTLGALETDLVLNPFAARVGITGMRRWRFQSVAFSGNAGGSVP